MIDILDNKKVRIALIALFTIVALLPAKAVFTLAGAGVKPRHIMGGLMGIYFIIHKSSRKITKVELAISAFLLVHSTLAGSIFGFTHWYISMIFTMYSFYLISRMCDDFTHDDWMLCIGAASAILTIMILVNAALQWKYFWYYLVRPTFSKPEYVSLLDGGQNLDSSWLGLFVFILAATCWWKTSWTIAFFYSILVNCRAGMIACIGFVLWMGLQFIRAKCFKKEVKVFFWKKGDRSLKRILSNVLPILVLCLFLLLQTTAAAEQQRLYGDKYSSFTENYMDRISIRNLGNEPGSVGRIRMWKWAPKEFMENPLGYGLGNAADQVRDNDPEILEANLHSIYISTLLDEGIVGILILALSLLYFTKLELPKCWESPLASFMVAYLVLGTLQFTLLDVYFWTAAAGYMNLRKRGELR